MDAAVVWACSPPPTVREGDEASDTGHSPAAAEFGLTGARTLGHDGAESPWHKRRELWPGKVFRLAGPC